MDELMKMIKDALLECFNSDQPQQIECDTSHGRIILLIAKSTLHEEDKANG